MLSTNIRIPRKNAEFLQLPIFKTKWKQVLWYNNLTILHFLIFFIIFIVYDRK